jgi:hypothetical protein
MDSRLTELGFLAYEFARKSSGCNGALGGAAAGYKFLFEMGMVAPRRSSSMLSPITPSSRVC